MVLEGAYEEEADKSSPDHTQEGDEEEEVAGVREGGCGVECWERVEGADKCRTGENKYGKGSR